MSRCITFTGRNVREILRDRLTLFFGVLFPVLILALMALIGRSVPVEIFPMGELAPGIAVFGLSFLSLFGGTLLSRDRAGAFMARLLSSPMTAFDLIAGYLLPLVPMGMVQSLLCLTAAGLFGLKLTAGVPLAALALTPMGLFYASLGLLLGSVLTDRQVGGICGALVTNLSAWLSGAWFDLSLAGGPLEAAAEILPFLHATRSAQAALTLDLPAALPHLAVTLLWSAASFLAAVGVMRRKM